MLVFAVLSLPLAVIESQTDTAVLIDLISRIPGLETVTQIDMPQRMGLYRVQVAFAHPIHYGLFCSTVLSLTWIGMKGILNGTSRYLAVFAIIAAVFLSLSSGALLSVAMQTGLIVWNFVFRKNSRRWLLLIGLCAFFYVVIDLLSNRTPLRVFMSYATFSAHNAFYRAIIFEWGMKNVWNNPIIGLGLRPWIRPSFMVSGSIDNYWLVMAVKFGIPGFLMIAGGFLDAMLRIGRRKLTPGSVTSNLRLGWMFSFVGLAFSLSTVHIWGSLLSFVYFLLGAGLWIASASDATEAVAASATEPPRPQPSLSRSPQPIVRQDEGGAVFARDASDEGGDAEGQASPYTRFANEPTARQKRRSGTEGSE